MKPRLTRSLVLAAAVVVPFAQDAPGWYPYGERYTQWQKDRPMLFAGLHSAVPEDRLADRIARFKAAGLNTFIWAKPANALHFFKAANDAGLPWACWGRGGEKAITKAMAIPGNAFIMTGDEPNSEHTEGLVKITKYTEWVRKTYPKTLAFANLSIPSIDHDVYVKACKPDVFSFDHYPLQRNGETQEHYLHSLAWGRQTAIRHRLPYWMYLQSYARKDKRPSYAYRTPDGADIRFLVFTFLAHGGTGIQWFIYYGYEESMVRDSQVPRPGNTPAERHTYETSYPTRSWFAVRDVAPEVKVLSRAIVDLRPKGKVGYVGNGLLWDRKAPGYGGYNPVIPFRNERFTGRGALRSVEILNKENLGALIGFLDDQSGQEYFMVVNLQHGKNMSKMDGLKTVRLVFNPSVLAIERLNRLTGRVEVLRTKGGGGKRTLDVRLEGGTGDLFKWSDGKPWTLR